MTSIVVHFPEGSKEFGLPAEPLKAGDVIWHEGARYRVVHVGDEDGARPSVTVERDSEDIGDLLTSERGGIVLFPVD